MVIVPFSVCMMALLISFFLVRQNYTINRTNQFKEGQESLRIYEIILSNKYWNLDSARILKLNQYTIKLERRVYQIAVDKKWGVVGKVDMYSINIIKRQM